MKYTFSLFVIWVSMMPSVWAGTYGCKNASGKLYISQTPCLDERLMKVKSKGMSYSELDHMIKVQDALDKSSKKQRKNYMNDTGDYSVEGCFSTSNKLYQQGEAISYRGYRFQCMKYHKSKIARYSFYSNDLLKQCRVDPHNRFCTGLNESSKQELMSQL